MKPNAPQLQWDEHGQPVSSRFGDVYFSKDNGLEESNYVFIQQNRLQEKFHSLNQPTFTIAETGFGTGLNFLLAWHTWHTARDTHPALHNKTLHFISVEKFPLSRSELSKACQLWPQLKAYSRELLACYPPENAPGLHRLEFEGGKIKLTLLFGEACECLQQLGEQAAIDEQNNASWAVDAWFLDGFAPAKNPDMWRPELIRAMARLSRLGTSFATFTAAGFVRRELIHQGFHCEKSPGFGRKREMLIGELKQAPQEKPLQCYTVPAWRACESIAIIGGGIAGCTLAWALARRGKKVTVFEQHAALATESSGNAQGVVYARLSPHNDALSRFNLASQLFANHFYQHHHLFRQHGEQCGVLHLATTEKHQAYYQRLSQNFAASGFARWCEQEEASAISGIATTAGGLFIEQAGWLNPPALCASLCEHPNITVKCSTPIEGLRQDPRSREPAWLLRDKQDGVHWANTVVVACAHSASQFPQFNTLQLKSIRGQVSHLPSGHLSVNTVLCGDGYIAPAYNGMQSLGATFNLNSTDTRESPADHQTNLDNLQAMLAETLPASIDANSLQGRVGFRCTSPDYFPLSGPVADITAFRERFAPWRKKAKQPLPLPGAYHPQLYCHLAFGSRALAYAPLCSEQLASLMCGEAPALLPNLYPHIHPARFVVRQLKRNQE